MSTSSQAAALAAFQGISNKSKSEIIHDKKNPPKFKIPLNVDTKTKGPAPSNTGGLRSPGPIRRANTVTTTASTIKSPVATKPLAKASTQQLQPSHQQPQLPHPGHQQQHPQQQQSQPPQHTRRESQSFIQSRSPLQNYSPSSPVASPSPSTHESQYRYPAPKPQQPLHRVDTSSSLSSALAAAAAVASSNTTPSSSDNVPATPRAFQGSYSRSVSGSTNQNTSSSSIYSHDSVNADYFNLHRSGTGTAAAASTPGSHLKKSSSQHSNLTTSEMIQKVKNSIDSKMKDAKSPKANSSSSDMIKQVKESINSKVKASTKSAADMSQKNQDRLNEIRETIDMKRIHTTRSPILAPIASPASGNGVYGPSSAGGSDAGGSDGAGNNGSASSLALGLLPPGPGEFERNSFHNSYSSIGSSLHSSRSDTVLSREQVSPAPKILVDEHGQNMRPIEVQNQESVPGSVPESATDSLAGSTVYLPQPNSISAEIDAKLHNSSEDKEDEASSPMGKSGSVSTQESGPASAPASGGSSSTAAGGVPYTAPELDSASVYSVSERKVPKRKPPPVTSSPPQQLHVEDEHYLSDSPSFNQPRTPLLDTYSSRSSFEVHIPHANLQGGGSSGGASIGVSELEVSEGARSSNSALKFPQFPSLDSKKHKSNKSSQMVSDASVSSNNDKYRLFGIKTPDHRSSEFFDREDDDEAVESSNEMEPAPAAAPGPGAGFEKTRNPIIKPHQPVRLKTTMRKTNKKKEKKLLFNENKPWKNHNDLDYITEQERKRYEGVWVSNKGAYLTSVVTKLVGVDYGQQLEGKEKANDETSPLTQEETSLVAARLSSKVVAAQDNTQAEDFHNTSTADLSQLIHGVVVKRIWQRSKLPNETLESIWNLVDFRHDGTLNKPEFLVGMWLVDQCLYGRKLPKKVDSIVWDSLGSIGLNVVVKKYGRR